MAHLTFNHGYGKKKALSVLIMICAFLVNTIAASETTNSLVEEDKKIHITSDLLISDSKSQIIEFKGNVKAIQEDTVITSNNMTFYYKKNPLQNGKIKPDEQTFSKITASGNVHINFDNRVAQAEQAVYTAENRILVLTGGNVMITSNTNTISGEKITLNRNDGKIIVEKGKGKQVEMVVISNGNGIK